VTLSTLPSARRGMSLAQCRIATTTSHNALE
jgi:hypothetical protein